MYMRNIKVVCMVLVAVVSLHLCAQTGFQKVKSIKGIKVTVKVLSPDMIVVIPDNQPNQRYTALELPAELRKDGLHLTIDGDIGAIPPNVRMIGTPFHMTCIHVDAAEKKKYGLSKKTYCLKK
ncbi:MAG: hypothetical protein JWO03_1513 [Bacteroidetes bacterium]|nr:hypothetical protein [Bacteroidota bacterium]